MNRIRLALICTISILGVAFIVFVLSGVIVGRSQAREVQKEELMWGKRGLDAVSAAHQLSIAALMYAADHHDRFPPATSWEQALKPYLQKLKSGTVSPPRTPDGTPRRFAMNSAMAGKTMGGPNDAQCILSYESTATELSASDHLESLPNPRSNSYVAIAWADGHESYYYPVASVPLLVQRSYAAERNR